MGMMSWLTGSAEKVTGWGEWLGILGLMDQDKVNKAENVTDVADAATKALEDGFQMRDLEDIGGTAAGAYVDQQVTSRVKGWLDKTIGKIPLIGGFLSRGVSSWLGNKAQGAVEYGVDAMADRFFGEDDLTAAQIEQQNCAKEIAIEKDVLGKYDDLDGPGDLSVDASGQDVSPAAVASALEMDRQRVAT